MTESGVQSTIAVNVDDCCATCAEDAELTRIEEAFLKQYGEVYFSHGYYHDFLGMKIDRLF